MFKIDIVSSVEAENFHDECGGSHELLHDQDAKVDYKVFDSCDFYANHVQDFATQQILRFFSDKELHCGGKIPHSLLSNPKRVNLVINLDLDSSVKIFYDHSEKIISEYDLAKSKRTGEASWDIIIVNEVLRLLSTSGIPQQFSGGMLLIYLELVKGYDIKL